MIFGAPLSAADAATFEDSVVPRYLSYFGGLCAEMILPSPSARMAHLGCRTGYPDPLVAEKAPHSIIVGVDSSEPALDVARAKATLTSDVQLTYLLQRTMPTELMNGSFSHAYSVHPPCDAAGRSALLDEMRRLLITGGQALLALPLRGSFPEINDMVREYAVRQDAGDLAKAIEAAVAGRPTIETISEEFESVGLSDVDVDMQLIAVSFDTGQEFLDDPIARLMVFPELCVLLPLDAEVLDPCLSYVREAISKYWSDGVFELTVNVGCASGRKF